MEPFLGQLLLVAFNFAPIGWALCNGQLLAISQNTALFSLLGTYYGGDGMSTFGLPDLRGRVPIAFGQSPGTSPYTIGQIGGVEQVTLTTSNLAPHTHPLMATERPATTGSPVAGASLLGTTEGGGSPPAAAPSIYSAATDRLAGLSSLAIGPNNSASAPFGVVPPYVTLNWIIALQGIFPSRS